MDAYELVFPDGYFGDFEQLVPSKGWLEVEIRFPDGRSVPLSFYDPVRLKQTLDDYVEQGFVHFTEPNLVVLTEVNTANVRKAVADLHAEGFFDRFRT